MAFLRQAAKVGRKFQNPVPTNVGGFSTFFRILPLLLTNKEERVPRTPLGPFTTDASLYDTSPASGLRITWMGHSSTLIEIDGVNLLIDPVWDERASPSRAFGPKRFFAPPLRLNDLPRIDAVLLSHDHYDHLGKSTVRQLAQLRPNLRWITSLGVGKILQRFGVPASQITELDWTQTTTVASLGGATCDITSLPSRHFSGRGISNRFETLWASFVLRSPQHSIYFGADSGFWEGFAEIGAEHGPFDLTMLEIGAYNDLWKPIHMGPDGAAQAFHALGGTACSCPSTGASSTSHSTGGDSPLSKCSN